MSICDCSRLLSFQRVHRFFCTMPKKFNCWICFALLSKVYTPEGQPYSWQNATGNKPNVPAMFSRHEADIVRSRKAGSHKRQD